jgi:cullin 1
VELLQNYANDWRIYKEQSDAIDGIFDYLNRHWIKREIGERSAEIFTVKSVSKHTKI